MATVLLPLYMQGRAYFLHVLHYVHTYAHGIVGGEDGARRMYMDIFAFMSPVVIRVCTCTQQYGGYVRSFCVLPSLRVHGRRKHRKKRGIRLCGDKQMDDCDWPGGESRFCLRSDPLWRRELTREMWRVRGDLPRAYRVWTGIGGGGGSCAHVVSVSSL